MGEVSTIGLDIAKSVFQVHGVDVAGAVVVRKRVNRAKVLEYFGELSKCLVGIEACPSAHHWGRELQALGHTVRLIPPTYVKAYLKRSKNDANDAAAICEAVTRPSMRFVPIKTKEQQTALMLHRTRQLLVRQRTMLSNALRGHLAELGIVSAKGRNGTAELLRIIADDDDSRVSPAVRGILDVLARQYGAIGTEIASIDKSIMALHRACEASRRLAEIPGIGPVVATALVAEIGDWNSFSSGRSLAEIGASRPGWQSNHPQLRTTEERPRLYYWTEKTEQDEVVEAETISTIQNAEPSTPGTREHDLYPALIDFLLVEKKILGFRIDERKSSNAGSSGSNRWLYPDVVGIENLAAGLHPEVIAAIKESSERKVKLWSLEVMRSNAVTMSFNSPTTGPGDREIAISVKSGTGVAALVATMPVGNDVDGVRLTLREFYDLQWRVNAPC